MDYANIRAAIDRDRAAEVIPRLALSMMRDIADGRHGLTAVRHPLGFLCFPAQRLGEHGVCVHLWMPSIQQALTTSQMHAHSWDLTSYVLYGSLRNQCIRVADASPSPTHRVFEVRSRGDLDELRATARLVSCRAESEQGYGAGSVYDLPVGEFHATITPAAQDVATVVLSRNQAKAADLALGPVDMQSHTLTRSRCDAGQTAGAAQRIVDRLAAAGWSSG